MFETIISLVALAVSVVTFWRTELKDRKNSTLEAYNRLQEQALDKLNGYTKEQINEIIRNRHSEEYMQLSAYVARIEHFAVGVNHKVYTPKIVYELAEGYLDGAIKKKIEPIISRKNYSNRDYYENIHTLYAWMEREKKKEDTKRAKKRK